MIYICVFFLSCFLFFVADKNKNNKLTFILALTAIVIPCALSGMRDLSIGTDVKVYVEPLYEAAKNSKDIFDFFGRKWYVIWRYMYTTQFEFGFSMMIYFIAKLGGTLSSVLFFIQFLIIAPLYFGLKRLSKPYPTWIGMAVFYFLFYNTSLNMMRQWIAMSILFYAFSFLVERNTKIYFGCVFIALLFHTSAIFGFLLYLLYKYIGKRHRKIRFNNIVFTNRLIPIKIFIFGCLALLSINSIIMLLTRLGLSKYIGYLMGGNSIYILYNQILIRLPMLVLFLFRWKKIESADHLTAFYASMMILDLLTSQLMSINPYAFRISSFFSEYNIISYSAIVYAGNQKLRSKKYIILLLVLVYLLSYWYYYYVFNGTHATYPYVFA